MIAIIPARQNSKGVKHKNVRLLNNKPLIAYTIESALHSKYINRVIVSTDGHEIANISRQYGAEIPFMRPDHLATDTASTVDVVLHLLDQLNVDKSEHICLLQCTSPFRTSEHIDEAYEKMNHLGLDAIVSVCETPSHPYLSMVIQNNRLEYLLSEARNSDRRQDFPQVYNVNGAIYCIKAKVFTENKDFLPTNTGAYLMPQIASLDIDTEYDFDLGEFYISKGFLGNHTPSYIK